MATEAEVELAAGFAGATEDQWRDAVAKVLKGGSFDRLVSRTADGIEVQPLYTGDGTSDDAAGFPGAAPFTRGAGAEPPPDGRWDIRVMVADAVPADAARWALRELERGATSLRVRLDAAFRTGVSDGAGVDGVAVTSLDDLDAALDGVLLDLAPVHLDAGAAHAEGAALLVDLWDRRGVDPVTVRGGVGADPVGAFVATGQLAEDALATLGALGASLVASHPQVTVAAVDTSVVAEAGGSPAQELGYLLATGAAYLRALSAAGLPADEAVRTIEPTVTVDADVFGGIAKLRAARRVWGHLAQTCGATAAVPRVHARTAQHMMTRRDPWVNLLRVTAATFAAGVGGAESLVTAPFDAAVGVPDELGRRMARNTQVVLQEESNIARVLDPAGGSWYVETLTEQLAAAAWAHYCEIEAAGGIVAALRSGFVAEQVAEVRTARQGLVARRAAPITGVSEFPDIDEAPVERAAGRPVPLPVPAGTGVPLPVVRWSEPFEALRDAADLAAERPTVLLVNLGPVAVHTARATFAKNFFEAGGIAAVTSARGGTDGYVDPADAVADLAGARLVCLCSSDALYEEHAVAFAAALRAAGVSRIYLAGNPGDRREAETAAGVDEFVHLGVDVLDVLTRAHQVLGVPAASPEVVR